MPGSTGPDLNTYTIPEVQLGDTFNVWRDASNTAIYKLNKLKVYDADTSLSAASIGATYTTAGVWTAFVQPTVTSGHTFSNLIRFTSGISASGGFTLGGNAWVVGGVSLADILTVGNTTTLNGGVVLGKSSSDNITVNGVFVNGFTASGAIRANAGLTATTLDVTSGAKVIGGLSASALYASTGSTFGSTVYVTSGATFAGTTDYVGAARFSGGLSASALYASTGSTFAAAVAVVGGLSASALYASAGSTFGSTVYVTSGATFAGTSDHVGAARFSGGLSASALYASAGSTFGSTVYVTSGATFAGTSDHVGAARFSGGLSASALYASAGSTFGSTVYVTSGATFAGTTDYVGAARFSGGLSASALYASTGSTFAAALVVVGGLSASALYASAGSTFGSTLYVTSGLTAASTLNVIGTSKFTGAITLVASSDLGTPQALVGTNITGTAAGFTVGSAGIAQTVSTAAQPTITSLGTLTGLTVSGGLSASALYASTGSTFAAALVVVGGLSASALYASAGSTFGSTLYVTSGLTAASTLNVIGTSKFTGAITLVASSDLGTPQALVGTNITGTAAGFTVGSAGIAQTVSTAAQPTITSLGTLTGLTVSGNSTVGYAAGATFGVSGSVFLQARAPLKFGDSTSAKWVGFQAPTTVTTTTVWTLPAADGGGGQVLSTNASGVLAWKSADGVTGTDKQIQFNMGGTLGATAGLVLEYNTAGYSAGTLGVSGGAYIMGNVGIGITTPAISSRLFAAQDSTTKLEVRGDIRIPSGGFFVTKNTSISTATTVTIAADENAFFCGTVVVASGATLSIASGGSLVIL